MISRFFIDRPIFAAVLSLVITLAGGVAVFSLPLAQFPKISPPVAAVTCSYPGASARDVAEAVAAPIEQQVNGVEGMMYMASSCTNDGTYNLTVTFIAGITGQFFRQFALTIAVSTLISAFNSLTLSPALTALLLRPRGKGHHGPPLPRLAFPAAGGFVRK